MNHRTTVSVFLAAIALVAWMPFSASAQTLSVRGVKTEVSVVANDFVDAYGEVKNLTTSQQRVRLLRTKNDLPDGWSASICFGIECYAPAVNDITVTLAPGETAILKVTFEASSTSGEGEVELHVSNASNPSEDYSIEFKARSSMTSTDRLASARSLQLSQNYPNPFSLSDAPITTIGYVNPRAANVMIKVYNLLGREVRSLVNEYRPAGSFVATWDARDNSGALLPPGIYIYKLMSGSTSLTRRMVLAR
jgi:hypothetical protein